MRIVHAAWTQLLDQRGYLFGWTPVLLGIGIAFYFAADVEPRFVFVRSFCWVV